MNRDSRHSPNGRDCIAGSGRSPSGAVPCENTAIAQNTPQPTEIVHNHTPKGWETRS
jgi:hypothetical protein